MSENKPSYYAIIPADVRYDQNIPPNAKLLYGEISALTNKEGYCYASNAYFCEQYEFSDRTITRLIEALESAGYITTEISRDERNKVTGRKIRLNVSSTSVQPPDKIVGTSRQNCPRPPDKIVGGNNTGNNKAEKGPLSDAALSGLLQAHIGEMGDQYRWTRAEEDEIFHLLLKFYDPDREGIPKKKLPKRTERGVNGMFSLQMEPAKGNAQSIINALRLALANDWISIHPKAAPAPGGGRMAPAAPGRSVDLGVELT